jgi:hypothetical protein
MPFNGTGIFNQIANSDFTIDAANGAPISSSKVENRLDDIEAGLSQVVVRDGQSSLTADLNFGGYKAINLANPTSAQHAVTVNWLPFSKENNAVLGNNSSIFTQNSGLSLATSTTIGAGESFKPAISLFSVNAAGNTDGTTANSTKATSIEFSHENNDAGTVIHKTSVYQYRADYYIDLFNGFTGVYIGAWKINTINGNILPTGSLVGAANIGSSSARIGQVFATGSYNTVSDEELKENFTPIDGEKAWQFMQELQNGKGFTWFTLKSNPDSLKIAGVSAQDCIAAASVVGWDINELAFLHEAEDGTFSISYSELQIILTAGIFWRLNNA